MSRSRYRSDLHAGSHWFESGIAHQFSWIPASSHVYNICHILAVFSIGLRIARSMRPYVMIGDTVGSSGIGD